MDRHEDDRRSGGKEFLERARKARPTSQMGEFLYLMKRTRKWWLAPIIFIFLLFGLLIILSSTGAAPFIYTLF